MPRRLTKSHQRQLDTQLAGLHPKIMPRPDRAAQFSGDEGNVPFSHLRMGGIRIDAFGFPVMICFSVLNFELWLMNPRRVSEYDMDDTP